MKMSIRFVLFMACMPFVVSSPSALAHTDVTPAQARDLIDSTDNLIVVDVREPGEYCDAIGHIPGALNYPLNSGVLQAQYDELPMDGSILVVCRSGGRSNAAANFLDSKGFTTVYDMMGGMSAWPGETVPCKYAGGSGTANDPYQIATAADLIALGETPKDYDKHFILTADIDLDPNLPGGRVFDRAVIGAVWIARSRGGRTGGTPFTGIFDGNGHTISHLTIKGWDNLGLFGVLESGGEIFNLDLEAVDVNGMGDYVGGLVGWNNASIIASHSTGSIRGRWCVGGLVGIQNGSVDASYSRCVVNGDSEVGGLVGWNIGGPIISSYTNSAVSGTWYVGGLAGSNGTNGVITACHSTGTVLGEQSTGGLVGSNGGDVSNSYSATTVSGDGWVGGLVGGNNGQITTSHCAGRVRGRGVVGGLAGGNDGSITTSYSTSMVAGDEDVGGLVGLNRGILSASFSAGPVTGDRLVGGLVGQNGSTGTVGVIYEGWVVNCYSLGPVTGNKMTGGLVGSHYSGEVRSSYSTGLLVGEELDLGGLVGWKNWDGRVFSSFWDVEVAGQPTSADDTGRTTAEMQTASTFLNVGWDFINETENGPNDIWTIVEGQTYPLLSWQKYGGGAGDLNDPYLIYTAEHLNALGAEPNDYDKHFKLMADIDLSGYTYDRAVIAPDTDPNLHAWGTNPFDGPAFTGVFDGNRHIISHLTIAGDSYVGLFGQLGLQGTAGEVHDLGLKAVDVTATDRYVGSLVGRNDRQGNVKNCYATGRVSGNGFVGGLVGYNLNHGSIMNSYSTVAVSGEGTVGGLVGRNAAGEDSQLHAGNITNCYATGTVTGTSTVGGLVGANLGNIIESYSTGAVTGNEDVGGLVGSGGYCKWSFWDIETSGQLTSSGGIGKTTIDMQTASTFHAWACGSNAVWTIDEGNNYPRLWWEDKPGETIKPILLSDLLLGLGTEDDPFLVYTSEELNLIGLAACDWSSHFRLMADIDMSGFDGKEGRPSFNIIGVEEGPFTGDFDGNGHTISHLSIKGTDCVGLFGCISRSSGRGGGGGGYVRNLAISSVSITGSGKFVGAIIGLNSGGIVSNCYSSGTVSGSQYTGGLVGRNWANYSDLGRSTWGSIRSSYSDSTVSGDEDVGGLVGTNGNGTGIIRCYSTGVVTGREKIGGLVGSGSGSTTSSFWDIETSGQPTSAGGTGLTTVEMQTASTFTEAGWDFIDETDNGTDDIWWIDEGKDYPRLWWEQDNQ